MIDYDKLEAEINRILDEQDFNFSTVDVQTSVYFAQEAVASYLLSMQESGLSITILNDELSKNLDFTEEPSQQFQNVHRG